MSTYMEIVEADDTNPNTIKKPAKAWRNWWRADTDGRLACGRQLPIGVPVCGPISWPSKDAAETAAAERIILNQAKSWQPEYLGAFAEGDHP